MKTCKRLETYKGLVHKLVTSYAPIILEQDKFVVLKQKTDITMRNTDALVVKLVDTKDLKGEGLTL